MTTTTLPVEEKAPSTFRLVITLFLAGLLSGLIIVTVFEYTLPMITANREARLKRAVLEVLPGATNMRPLNLEEIGTDGSDAASNEGEASIYAGFDDDGALVGYAIPGEGPGFQDTIALIFGWDPARRRIVGLQILESRETPGLGDKIYKDERWMTAFRDLAAEPEVLVVKGGASEPHEIDAITGATISSKAVAKIINTATGSWFDRLPEEAPSRGENP